MEFVNHPFAHIRREYRKGGYFLKTSQRCRCTTGMNTAASQHNRGSGFSNSIRCGLNEVVGWTKPVKRPVAKTSSSRLIALRSRATQQIRWQQKRNWSRSPTCRGGKSCINVVIDALGYI